MDGSRFDGLTRRAGVGGSSRRLALRTALSGATVAAAGLLTSVGSDAKKKRKKKKCPTTTCTPKAIGAICESVKECCGSETGLSCAKPNNAGPIDPPVCCGTEGVACANSSQCCDGFECAPFCTRH